MDGRLQDFRGDFAGAVSIGIVTGEGKRYQGRKGCVESLLTFYTKVIYKSEVKRKNSIL